jgi:predicted metal-binding membrane protein
MDTSPRFPGELEQKPRSAAGRLLVRQRILIVGALAGLLVLCWLHLAGISAGMSAMDPNMAMPPKNITDLVPLLAMWWVMMIGMMLPSAAPMMLTFASVNRNARARGQPYVPTAIFAAGYVLAWGGFSIAATVAQWALEQASLLSPMAMKITSPALGGALFVAAGLYQLTPLKGRCLSHCRSPFDFVINHWRSGSDGALRMGLEHGLYCLGCCWILMVLLFAVGAMNLLWVAGLAAVVLVEKLFPSGIWIARLGGLLLIGLGARLMTAA